MECPSRAGLLIAAVQYRRQSCAVLYAKTAHATLSDFLRTSLSRESNLPSYRLATKKFGLVWS